MTNPYKAPKENAKDKSQEDWKPNTWLTNWSLFFIILLICLDGLFVLFVTYRDQPFVYFAITLFVDLIVIAPVAVMLWVDGFRAARAAPKRMLVVVGFALFHILGALAHLLQPS